VSYTDRRDAFRARERELRQNVQDIETMTKMIDDSRGRLESNLAGLDYSAEEMKGQIRILRERQSWLISELDKLRTEINS
jgi:uncharacterized protein HemX